MAVLIRAGDVPAARRADTWLSIVCETLGPLDVRMDRDRPLRGQIEAVRLGPLGVGRIETSTPHSVHRTPGLIRRDDPEHYRVVLAVSGTVLLGQDGRTARLRGGDLAIYDFSRPYELVYDSAVQLAVFSFARAMLTVPADAVRRLAAVPIAAEGGTAALAAPLLRRVAEDAGTYDPASAARLPAVVMDLLDMTIAERTSQVAALVPETRERVLLRRVHAFVERHLGDTGLGPGMIAAAHHVSLRHLHRLFESQDTTVAAWIRHRRLERCRRDLTDPAMAAESVSGIAARWGLPDPAHFSRLFRRAYGASPAEYRRASLEPGARALHGSSTARH
ncbi:helix-turn-helix domain-containing protein [Actinomadura nitritigenes]|uniref:Helix-turn-helix domain-containing protein n=1 Tax=Actinomadura nitritigenes TaxID=134602 RepID=A0ABS3REE6_9ACTN|nr:helix-turn-helix domain-containing protein [Actinomadura nitritigenes]MBO2444610.1 helix-turn-helix domain-containing protein [Actinomadura nitritigenes]